MSDSYAELEYTINLIDGKWCIDGCPITPMQLWAMVQMLGREIELSREGHSIDDLVKLQLRMVEVETI